MDGTLKTPRIPGRPGHNTKRLAIEKLLLEGFTPSMVRDATGSSLTVIYEVRRAIQSVHLDPDAEGRGTTTQPLGG